MVMLCEMPEGISIVLQYVSLAEFMMMLNLRFLLQDFSGEEEKENETVLEIQLLVQCLTIICRHFDNITTIIKSSYISSCVALINSIIDKVSKKRINIARNGKTSCVSTEPHKP